MNPETTTEPVLYGVQETKDVLKLVISLGSGLEKSLADGKLSFNDAENFYPLIKDAPAAFKNIALVPKELGQLTSEERAEILAFVEKEFDIANDKLEFVIEKALGLALAIYEVVGLFRTLKK